MDGLRDLAGRLDTAGGSLADLARRLPYAGPDGSAFAADEPGRLGEVGGILHRQWSTALDNRARELLATAERLTDTGTALRVAATGYADSDAAAYHRRPEEA
ncbi:hypothetical protein GCM10022225_51810 [Plantactinospora mayteni]|uniref:Excreted virulence factor EspC (Type VII ESX diderm) n=1 Tax=Plantactinospora mayteni TaxID=566021 RepID=A0ABQ4EZ05_9ACTN|nr:hypothetical protein [Plantactinospora mayteni]GIG99902.1 hypothetical protein Pma05_64750 [Plantactinospora mayteni]